MRHPCDTQTMLCVGFAMLHKIMFYMNTTITLSKNYSWFFTIGSQQSHTTNIHLFLFYNCFRMWDFFFFYHKNDLTRWANHIIHDILPHPHFLSSFSWSKTCDCNTSWIYGHFIHTFSFFMFNGQGLLFVLHTFVIQRGFIIVILLWIWCILAII